MSKGIIVSPANRGVQVVVTDENNVQLLVDSNRGVNLEIVPQPRIEVLVDKGVEGPQGPAGEGVPTGGTTGQVLAKASNANYDTVWATITGTLVYQGSWNASTNTPTLTSSVGTNGYYYVVGTSGSTNLNGITDWVVGDWAIFNGSVWQKIDNTDLVSSVNGQTGVVVLDAADVGALSDITSTDGSVTITSPNATTRDLSVAVAGATTNVLCLVRNTTGATLTKGTVVYISGATGQNPTVSKAIATSDATSAQTLGMMTADLANNSNGYVTVIGLITNIDTSAYTDGQQLYLSGTVAGAVTATKPHAPIHLVYVAVVEHAHPTQGKLFVKVQNGYELDEIHDVSIVSPTTGQTLVYNATNDLWENSNAPVISGTTINNTVIGGTTPAAGTFTTLGVTTSINAVGTDPDVNLLINSKGTGSTIFNSDNGEHLRIFDRGLASVVNYAQISGATNTNAPRISGQGSGANVPLFIGTKGTSQIAFYTNNFNQEQFRVSHTASAVNYVQVTGAATGSSPVISMQGSDSSISFLFQSKGSGTGAYFTNSAFPANNYFSATNPSGVASANRLNAAGAATTFSPVLSAQGSDTNIAQVFQSKGTGAIDLAAGSSGVNISNGGTVTAITRTAAGSAYTSQPTVAISAPTTAGGVQATATFTLTLAATPTVSAGGSGYTVGDVLTITGGTSTQTATVTVATVSAGAVATVTISNFGIYTVAPSNPASVTGGTGTGATFNLSFGIFSATITNAGSGYVEQPTISFSGGGGSGAAAYATVGSGTTIKSIGATLDLSVDNTSSQAFRFYNSGGTGTAYWSAASGSTSPFLYAQGASNVTGRITSNGTGSVALYTGGGAQLQFNVSHTASAVNYVQVTGAATGTGPTISSQGSDANARLLLNSKGSSSGIDLLMNNSRQVFIGTNGSAVNYLLMGGTATGFGPAISSAGSDTNIPLVLQPKGTGALQAQQTDSTATGGNARGANAVDWQTIRSTAVRVASGQSSVVAGGASNAAQGYVSVASGGDANISSAAYGFIGGGSNNIASGLYGTVVGGSSNTGAGYYNFIGAGFTNSGTASAAVTTQSATMNGTTAVTLAASNANIKVGQYITGTSINANTYVAAISGTSLTLSQAASGSSTSTLSFYTPHGVIVGGGNNQATGSYSFIGGGGDAGTAANRNVASGDWSKVGGGVKNVASGAGSVVAGGGYDGTIYGNIASGLGSVISGGIASTASGNYSTVVGGAFNSSNGQFSTVIGANGQSRAIVGNIVTSAQFGAVSFSNGTAQGAILIIGKQTTDATSTRLTSDGNAASTTNQVILPNNSAYTFRGEIVSGVTGGGNSKSWTIEGLIKRGANAASTTLVGSTVTSMYADVGAATWTIALSADTTNGGLAVTFTGQAGTTIRTVCSIRTTEMTF